MSGPTMVPMISPDGDVGDIPHDQVDSAIRDGGFKMGVELQTDDGQTGVVPVDQAHEAIASGKMHLAPPKVQKPNDSMSPMPAGIGQASEAQSLPSPKTVQGRQMEQMIQEHPTAAKAAGGLAIAAGVGEAASAASMIPLPAVLPHTIAGVKALGEWAAKNPVQAYLLYNVMKELIPGAKKAMRLVEKSPAP